MIRQGAWIDVYPFNGRNVSINNSGTRVQLSKELSDYCDLLWKPKADKGWTNSWISFAEDLIFQGDKVSIYAGAMPFHQVDGIIKSIEEEKPFSPEIGYSNCLSVSFLTATKDAKVIFQRRAPDVHCPNVLIHEPCGYMASMNFVPRQECDNPRYADDLRLFSLEAQLEFRKREIANIFGISTDLVSYDKSQDFLATGWLTKEMYFSTAGKIEAKSTDLNLPESQEVFFVPFEYLKQLIRNQGRLSKVKPEGYRPTDPRQIPLIDESLIGLIYSYERLTGEKLDINETINRLNKEGMKIRVMDTSPGNVYEFPDSL